MIIMLSFDLKYVCKVFEELKKNLFSRRKAIKKGRKTFQIEIISPKKLLKLFFFRLNILILFLYNLN